METHEVSLQVRFDILITAFCKLNLVQLRSTENRLIAVNACVDTPEFRAKFQDFLSMLKSERLLEALENFDKKHQDFPIFQWCL